MIVSLIAAIVLWQLNYTLSNKIYKDDLNQPENLLMLACACISYTMFNMAHWTFAFSYLVLSYRMELTAKNLPEDTYNCRLNTVNILVILFTVVVSAIVCIFAAKRENKATNIANDIA